MNNSDYVRVKDYIPDIYEDIRYATDNNFTHKVIYEFDEAYLRYGTTMKLKKVQEELNTLGFSLKIWDAYRPFKAQQYFWDLIHDSDFVADPTHGPKTHNFGNVVDVTLVKSDGTLIPMPTEFDDFTSNANRDYSHLTGDSLFNVQLLEKTMEKHGFFGYEGEWWHFTDYDSYEYVDFDPNKNTKSD